MEINGGFWKKEKIIGKGSSALVFLARNTNPETLISYYSTNSLPPLMAVKGCKLEHYCFLVKEREIFSEIGSNPYIIDCYGGKFTLENNETIFNLLLEFAPCGSLYNRIKSYNNGIGLQETEIRNYTKCILMGLNHIHNRGYVHRDIKPHNILICKNNVAKIADFGLSTKSNKGKKSNFFKLKGTYLYMAPESVFSGEYEPACDVWALGCVVLEMFTGKNPWNLPPNTEVDTLLEIIGYSNETPLIPNHIPSDAKCFIQRCLVKDPKYRWTIDMLLRHPFVQRIDEYEDDIRPNLLMRKRVINGYDVDGNCLLCRKRKIMAAMGKLGKVAESNCIGPSDVKRRKIIDMNEVEEEVSRSKFSMGRYWCNRSFAEGHDYIPL